MNWTAKNYSLIFLIGVVSAAVGIPLGGWLTPFSYGSSVFISIMIWFCLHLLYLLSVNRRAARIALPLSILILLQVPLRVVDFSFPLSEIVSFLSPIKFIFSPIFPFFPFLPFLPFFPLIIILALSHLIRDKKDVSFALKAVALSYLGLASVISSWFSLTGY